MKASSKCETCEGEPEIEIENDSNTADDNEYKCSPCTVKGADYYFDTTEKKCKTCENGTIAADGKTCTPCVGTPSLDFKTCNPCTDQGANYYFDTTEKKCLTCENGTIADDGKTCKPCEGTVSLDFKTCNPCDKAGKNEYYNKTNKACTECIGTVSNSTTCMGCNQYHFFNKTTLKCEYCYGKVSADKTTCTLCSATKQWFDVFIGACVNCGGSD